MISGSGRYQSQDDIRVGKLKYLSKRCVNSCLTDVAGFYFWWTCGGVNPAVGDAIAPSEPKDPKSLEFKRGGESHAHMLPIWRGLSYRCCAFPVMRMPQRLLAIAFCSASECVSPIVGLVTLAKIIDMICTSTQVATLCI